MSQLAVYYAIAEMERALAVGKIRQGTADIEAKELGEMCH
jgi:hypothetical protein